VEDGPGEIAGRVVQALEAFDASVAALPWRVADSVLVALGSSAGEHPDLARTIAAGFRADVTRAVESSVRRALLGIGRSGGPA
jgi:hypothetical protein